MTLTVGDLVKSVLRLVGALAKSETPAADEMQDTIQALNMMLLSWSARKLLVRSTVSGDFPLTVNLASYNIGTGQTFNTPKPLAITSAYLIDSNNVESDLEVVSREVYNSYDDKLLAIGRPVAIAYDPNEAQQASQYGTIFVYYIPDQAYTLHIEQQKILTELGAAASVLTFEGHYYKALKFNGAKEIYREYRGHDAPIPADILEQAAESMRIIETLNATTPRIKLDIPGGGSRFNIYQGDTT